MAEDEKRPVKRLDDYSEAPLIPFEMRRVRRTLDVVDELEARAHFKQQFRNKMRGWVLWIGLAAATFTALTVLQTAGRDLLRLFLGVHP